MRVRLLGTGSADRWPNPWCRCASCSWARSTGALRDRTSALVDDVLLLDPGPDAGGRGVDLSRVRTVLITHDHPDHLDPAFLLAWQWAAAATMPDEASADAAGRSEAPPEQSGSPRAPTAGPSGPSAEARPPESSGRSTPLSPPGRPSASRGDLEVSADPPMHTLLVAGPETAIERCRSWIASDSPVELRALAAGDTLLADGHVVTALPAAHSTTGGQDYDGTALLYDIAGPDGRLLYATDTAGLPHDDLADGYDIVLLEETFGDLVGHGTAHLDLPSFAREVEALRGAGRLRPESHLVAVHLSHHNGPHVADRLAALGAQLLPDGTELTVGAVPTTGMTLRLPGAPTGAPDLAAAVASAESALAHGHPRRLLVTGGARSGKSHFAESVVTALGVPVTYVATAPSYPDDPEWQIRIAAHRARRPTSWRTVESADIAAAIRDAARGECLIVDCLTLWLTSVLDRTGWDAPERAHSAVDAALADVVRALGETSAPVVLVTNEVGSGIVPDQPSGRLFRDLLGRANVSIAAVCSDVVLVTAGIPAVLKGAPWNSST